MGEHVASDRGVRARGQRNAVTVTVMPTFAANWLIPRLKHFHVQHKAVEIMLETSAEIEDLNARPRIDCAFRPGFGPWPGLVCEPLLARPVPSPGHLAIVDERFEPRARLHQKPIGTNQPEGPGNPNQGGELISA